MKKILIFILFPLMGMFLFTNASPVITKSTKANVDTFDVDLCKDIDSLINVYSDSIDSALDRGAVPKFIYNQCFDYDNLFVYNLHESRSLRTQIVSRSINIKSIEWIIIQINNNKNSLCNISSNQIALPNYKISWRNLLIKRQNDLLGLSSRASN
jgi:hypothetical protein